MWLQGLPSSTKNFLYFLRGAPIIDIMVVSISSSQGIPVDARQVVFDTTKALHYHIVVENVVTGTLFVKKCGFVGKARMSARELNLKENFSFRRLWFLKLYMLFTYSRLEQHTLLLNHWCANCLVSNYSKIDI